MKQYEWCDGCGSKSMFAGPRNRVCRNCEHRHARKDCRNCGVSKPLTKFRVCGYGDGRERSCESCVRGGLNVKTCDDCGVELPKDSPNGRLYCEIHSAENHAMKKAASLNRVKERAEPDTNPLMAAYLAVGRRTV